MLVLTCQPMNKVSQCEYQGSALSDGSLYTLGANEGKLSAELLLLVFLLSFFWKILHCMLPCLVQIFLLLLCNMSVLTSLTHDVTPIQINLD